MPQEGLEHLSQHPDKSYSFEGDGYRKGGVVQAHAEMDWRQHEQTLNTFCYGLCEVHGHHRVRSVGEVITMVLCRAYREYGLVEAPRFIAKACQPI